MPTTVAEGHRSNSRRSAGDVGDGHPRDGTWEPGRPSDDRTRKGSRRRSCCAGGLAAAGNGPCGGGELRGDVADRGTSVGEPSNDFVLLGGGEAVQPDALAGDRCWWVQPRAGRALTRRRVPRVSRWLRAARLAAVTAMLRIRLAVSGRTLCTGGLSGWPGSARSRMWLAEVPASGRAQPPADREDRLHRGSERVGGARPAAATPGAEPRDDDAPAGRDAVSVPAQDRPVLPLLSQEVKAAEAGDVGRAARDGQQRLGRRRLRPAPRSDLAAPGEATRQP